MNHRLIPGNSSCLNALRKANLVITESDNFEEVQSILLNARDSSEELQEAAKEAKQHFSKEAESRKMKIRQLETEEQNFYREIAVLNSQKSEAELNLTIEKNRLTKSRQELAEAKDKLREAQNELERAEKNESSNVSKGAIIGAVVFGVFTWGVGAPVGAAIGAAGGAIHNLIEGKCDDARTQIDRCESRFDQSNNGVKEYEASIRRTEQKVGIIRSQLRQVRQDMDSKHEEITSIMSSIDFCEKSCEFWLELNDLSRNAVGRTERLQEMLQKAFKKQDVRLFRSRGTIVLARSWVEAWEQIFKKSETLSINC